MITLNKNIQIRNLGFNQIASIFVPAWNTWKSEVQNDKGFRVQIKYPISGLTAPQKLKVTASNCRGFVEPDPNNKTSITTYGSGGTLDCMFDITSFSPYIAMDPSTDHYINIQCLIGDGVNFDVEISSFDIGGEIPTCTSGPVTPGFSLTPIKNPDRSSIIRDFSLNQVACLTLPPRSSSDWGSNPPVSFSVVLSQVTGLTRPKKWEMILSECPGSFEEALPASVGRTSDYHLISSSTTGSIQLQYEGVSPVGSGGPGPGSTPPCTPGPTPSGIGDYDGTYGGVFYPMPPGIQYCIRVDTSKYPARTGRYLFQTVEAPGFQGATILSSVSLCPGDFNPPAGLGSCRLHAPGTGGSIEVVYNRPFNDRESLASSCKLPASRYIYFNFKQVLTSNPSQPSCVITNPSVQDPSGQGCAIKVSIQFL